MNNKDSTTAERLQEIMTERGLTQADVLALAKPYCNKYNVKMNKSSLSQYCNGKNVPLQDKLFVLALALNVSEGWLMGYDVSKKRMTDAERFEKTADAFNNANPWLPDDKEKSHIAKYHKLNDAFKTRIDNLTDALLSAQEAEDTALLAAHQRTDVTATAEDKKHDEDIMKEDF